MIKLPNGYVEWDYQIGTFRADLGGQIYGAYTGNFTAAADLSAALPEPLTADQINDLEAEKAAWGQ